MKQKTFLRVSGLLAALIATVTALTCAFALKHHRASTRDVFGAQLAVLSDRAEGLILWEDRVALGDLLRGTVRDHEVVEYAFIERLGRPYVHTFDKGIPKALLALPPGAPGTPLIREFQGTRGSRFLDLAMSIGDERAVLHLGLSYEAVNRQALPQVLSVTALGGAAVAIGIVLAAATTGLITREVDQATGALRAEISERRRAERELARYRDQLEELVRQRARALEESQEKTRQAERLASIGTFAAGVAHEINNPLASILMSARHALRSMQDRSIVGTSLGEIIEDSERCAHNVKGLLLFAKQRPSEKEPVHLNDVVQRATDLTRKHAARRGVHLEVDISEGLPSVTANLAELVQVFVNVIKNAIEACSEGQTVCVQTTRDHDTVLVRVQDRGRGMTPEEKRHAFDPFFTTRAREGDMNSGQTVFVVDDDPSIRRGLQRPIESVGLTVEEYATAEEFLNGYDLARSGCLVLDVRMPGLSGLDLQETLAARGITLPIVFITAYGDVPMTARAMKAGAVDFLPKPFNEQALLDAIHNAIEQDTQRRREQARRTEVLRRVERLTPREREVLKGVVAGKTNKRIAAELGISEKTVKIHRAGVMGKMQADSVPELVVLAQVAGLYTTKGLRQ